MLRLLAKELPRRDFMKNSLIALIALRVMPILQGCTTKKYTPPPRSRVIRVTNPDATDKTGGQDNVNLDTAVVRDMVDTGIKAFTGKDSVDEAWREIIPDPKARERQERWERTRKLLSR